MSTELHLSFAPGGAVNALSVSGQYMTVHKDVQ